MRPHSFINSLPAVLLFLIITAIAAIAILAGTPPVSRDALTHHLAIPKLYLAEGTIREFPEIVFSYYPMNLDLLYAVALYFGNDILPKYIHFVFGLITAWGIGRYLKERFSAVYGLLGALLFLTLPVIVKLSSTVYVDLGLCCFTFYAFLLLLKWRDRGFQYRYVVAAGIMCGLALGTKYNALIGFLILTLLVLWLQARSLQRAADSVPSKGRKPVTAGGRIAPVLISGLLFISAALVVFSPWMIRNVMWTGNPIYPLYDQLFRSDHQHDEDLPHHQLETPAQRRLPPLVHRRLVDQEPFWYTALIPLRIFFEGRDDNPKYFDGKLNPFLFLLPLAAFGSWRKAQAHPHSEDYFWLAVAGLVIAITFFTAHMRIRYIVAAVPALVILSVSGVHRLMTWRPRSESETVLPLIGKIIGIVAVLAALAYNSHYIGTLYQRYTPLDYHSGALDREAYIEKHRPEYALFRYANASFSNNDKILGIFMGNRRYYSDIPIEMNETIFLQALRGAQQSMDIALALTRQGFTHLMVHRTIFHYWIDVNLDEEKVQMVHGFIATGLEELKKTEDYSLYEIITSDAIPMGGSTDGDQAVPTSGYSREIYVSKQTYMYRHPGL